MKSLLIVAVLILAGGMPRAVAAQEAPRRAVAFASIEQPFERRPEVAETRARARPKTVGAILGGIVGGGVGFAGGYAIDNIESSDAKVGSATVIATAGGVVVGALVGGAVGWLFKL